MQKHIKGIVPQFLVTDLDAALTCYRDNMGFNVDFIYDDFYAGISRDGCVIHLKCAPNPAADKRFRKDNEHLDAYIDVDDVQGLFEELSASGAGIIKPLEDQPWQCRDFYVEDVDGHILCFSENLP